MSNPWDRDPSCPVCRSVQFVEPDSTTFHTHYCYRCQTVFTPGCTPDAWAIKAAKIYRSGITGEARHPATTKPLDAACLTCGEHHAICPDPTPSRPQPAPTADFYAKRNEERRHLESAAELVARRTG